MEDQNLPIMFSLTEITGRKAGDERIAQFGGLGEMKRATALRVGLSFFATLPVLIFLSPLLGIYAVLWGLGVWVIIFTLMSIRSADGLESNMISTLQSRRAYKKNKIYLCGVEMDPWLIRQGVLGQGATWTPVKEVLVTKWLRF